MLTLSRREVRAIDQAAVDQLGISGLTLMENAARGASDVLKQHFRTNVAGQGRILVQDQANNGGDGFALVEATGRRWNCQRMCVDSVRKRLGT
ncbi:MAG: NAD(P)H-hydrate epimerase [Planctomycetaceae bacterium]